MTTILVIFAALQRDNQQLLQSATIAPLSFTTPDD
jgi:hypothetical protein